MAISECVIGNNDILAEATTLDFELAKSVDAKASDKIKDKTDTHTDSVVSVTSKDSSLNKINDVSSKLRQADLKDSSIGSGSTLDGILSSTKDTLCWKPERHTPSGLKELAKQLDQLLSAATLEVGNLCKGPNGLKNVLSEVMSYNNDLESVMKVANKINAELNLEKLILGLKSSLSNYLNSTLGVTRGTGCLLNAIKKMLSINNSGLSTKADLFKLGVLDKLLCDITDGTSTLFSDNKHKTNLTFEVSSSLAGGFLCSISPGRDPVPIIDGLLKSGQVDKHSIVNGIKKNMLYSDDPLNAALLLNKLLDLLKNDYGMSGGEIEIFTKVAKNRLLAKLNSTKTNTNRPKNDYSDLVNALRIIDSKWDSDNTMYETSNNEMIVSLAEQNIQAIHPSFNSTKDVNLILTKDEQLVILSRCNNNELKNKYVFLEQSTKLVIIR